MEWGLLLLVLALAFIWAATQLAPRRPIRDWRDEFPGVQFRPEPLLVNASERAAWDFLQRADLGQAHIFAKVRMEDVVSAQGPERRRFAARGHIKSRHIDFLLTDADFRPLVAVEVDGRSHRSEKAAVSDDRKDRILYLAGVPLLRLPVGADWNKVLAEWRREQAAEADIVGVRR